MRYGIKSQESPRMIGGRNHVVCYLAILRHDLTVPWALCLRRMQLGHFMRARFREPDLSWRERLRRRELDENVPCARTLWLPHEITNPHLSAAREVASRKRLTTGSPRDFQQPRMADSAVKGHVHANRHSPWGHRPGV